MESVYVLVFIAYAPKKEKAKILGLFTFVLVVFSVVALVSIFSLHGNSRKLFCGVAAAISSIVPNGFGCALGALQLILYFFYKGGDTKKQQPTAEDSVEPGLENSVNGV
ncbi:hypothetical protein ACLB2K_014022 [Fragaria x ananassa]